MPPTWLSLDSENISHSATLATWGPAPCQAPCWAQGTDVGFAFWNLLLSRLDKCPVNNDKCDECSKAVWDAAGTGTVDVSTCSIFLNCLAPNLQTALQAPLQGDRNFMLTLKSS